MSANAMSSADQTPAALVQAVKNLIFAHFSALESGARRFFLANDAGLGARVLREGSTCESADELYLALRHAFFRQQVPVVGAELAKVFEYETMTVRDAHNPFRKGENPVRELVDGLWADGHRALGKRMTAEAAGLKRLEKGTCFLPCAAAVTALAETLAHVKAAAR